MKRPSAAIRPEWFMSSEDAARATDALKKLRRHETQQWVLTGGFATEIHSILRGLEPSIRSLNDIDFVVSSFEYVPESLSRDFLCRHIHPFDPPGKTLAQFIDAATRIRIDLFRAYGSTVTRAQPVELSLGTVLVISVEDLIARLVRLVLQLAEGTSVASKYADELVRMLKLLNPDAVESAWLDHRLTQHPTVFREACGIALELIETRPHLLLVPEYSKNTAEPCRRCVPSDRFRVVDPALMLSIMGYC
jgi:hypothetical protein